MDEMQFRTLMAVLLDLREQLRVLCAVATDPGPEPVESSCDHPDDARIDLSTPGWVDWTCGTCGHHEQRRIGIPAPASPASA